MAESSITLEFANITKELENQVQDILHSSIEDFKKCVKEEAENAVYNGPYEPVSYPYRPAYRRRGENGGLMDTGNYEVIEDRLSLKLTNKTRSNPLYWAYTYSTDTTELVEEGTGYGWIGVPERPFMDKALDKFAHDVLEPKITALGGD